MSTIQISESPSFFINEALGTRKPIKYCTDGHKVGSEKIHKNLHTLFKSIPRLLELDVNKYNVILMCYWEFYDEFIVNQRSIDWPFNLLKVTSCEGINREVRNILEPKGHSQRGNIREKEFRDQYARDVPSQL